jgi:hypothetical protein
LEVAVNWGPIVVKLATGMPHDEHSRMLKLLERLF